MAHRVWPMPVEPAAGSSSQENGQPVVNAPLFLANVELRAAEDGDTRAVIAAILEAAQPFHQDWAGVLFSDVSDDAAHKVGTRMRDPP